MSSPPSLPHSPAAERNKEPIAKQLVDWFAEIESVIEIAAGTGQHAEYFAEQLPHVSWLPTDLQDKQKALLERWKLGALDNLKKPQVLDANQIDTTFGCFDALFMANGLQIMPWEAFASLCEALPVLIDDGGQVVIYSPLAYENKPLEPSNRSFDRMLRRRSAHMGVRTFEKVCDLVEGAGFECTDDVAMPANNHLIRFINQR